MLDLYLLIGLVLAAALPLYIFINNAVVAEEWEVKEKGLIAAGLEGDGNEDWGMTFVLSFLLFLVWPLFLLWLLGLGLGWSVAKFIRSFL